MIQLSPLSRPYVYALILYTLLIILYTIFGHYNLIPGLFEPLIAGLTTATLASYITSVLINRSFRKQEHDRQNRMRDAAYQDLKRPVERHIHLLLQMYIATLEEYPENRPTDYQEFFDNEFLDQIERLDFNKKISSSYGDYNMGCSCYNTNGVFRG